MTRESCDRVTLSPGIDCTNHRLFVKTYRAAQRGLTLHQNLPYGLDVYTTKKVLNIEWDDNGNVVLVRLHPGAWETELITLASFAAGNAVIH